MDEKFLKEEALCLQPMIINNPTYGFTRYLAQFKEGEPYMSSNMEKDFVFYEPYNKKVFKLFSNNKKERQAMAKEWDNLINNKDKYVCQNIDFIDMDSATNQVLINQIFNKPNKDLAKVMQEIAEEIIQMNPNYDICVGVIHGEQITINGKRPPHMHLLLKEKNER